MVAEMFIGILRLIEDTLKKLKWFFLAACGILYAVDSTIGTTKIRFGLDLYTGKLTDIDTPFTNPFNGTTTVGYNHNTKELYSWDLGNQLTYPVRIIAMGTNHTAEEPFEKILRTVGHTVFRHN